MAVHTSNLTPRVLYRKIQGNARPIRTDKPEPDRFIRRTATMRSLLLNYLTQFCPSTEAFTISAMGDSVWLFPAVETIHLVAMILLVGSISVYDLRLLGLILKGERVSVLTRRLLPLTGAA